MENKNIINSSSVILASGGAKGITAHSVIKLAEKFKCKFILVGRSSIDDGEPEWAKTCQDENQLKRQIMEAITQAGEKPTPKAIQNMYRTIMSTREINTTLASIEKAGGQAVYISTDISDADNLNTKVTEAVKQLGPVTGVIHGAGSLADKLIENKTLDDFDTVYNPKVTGLKNILALIPPGQLTFLVLFSSVAGFFGNSGQADYAIANEVLNKTAYIYKNRHPDCHVISINWGPWEAGMVTPQLKKIFEKQGIPLISLKSGTDMLIKELSHPRNDVQVVCGTPIKQPAGPLTLELKTSRIIRILNLGDNPFLNDHVIGKNPVLPATCSVSWLAHSCEELYPGYMLAAINNYKVLKGIVFDDAGSHEYIMDIQEVEKEQDSHIKLKAIIWSLNGNGKRLNHYSADIALINNYESNHTQIDSAQKQDFTQSVLFPDGQNLYHDGTLFHGPSFQGIKRVFSIDEHKLVMEVLLPGVDQKTQGNFAVKRTNPFINDVSVQSLLVWSKNQYKAACLPSQMKKYEQQKPVSFDTPYYVITDIQSHNPTKVVGNITVQDLRGEPIINFYGIEGTISQQLNRFIG